MNKDYYNILEVDKNATKDEIKKAYRKLSKKYHPDVSKEVESEAKFKEVSEAYDILSNDEKKDNYDRYGTSDGPSGGFGGFGGFGGGFNMEDIFGQFGNIFGNKGRGRNQNNKKKGSDLRIKVSLNIHDIINGVVKNLKYKRQAKCEPCNGKGGNDVKKCTTCKGSGEIVTEQNSPFGIIQQSHSCNSCNGTGEEVLNKCNYCNGLGTQVKEQSVEVEIPKGVGNGMQMKMSGFGNYIRSGEDGDLIIIFDEIRDSYFRRDAGNIIIDKEISIIDATIGAVIVVKTPRGDVNITIEAGTQVGKVIRVNGKGIEDINYGMGSLIINIIIKIPKSITEEEKNILTNLRNSENFK